MRHLYFVRHGESKFNQQRLHTGQTDTPLTEHGREQARRAGRKASRSFDLIISSPLVRALETAQLIATGINYPLEQITTNPIFMERSLGSLEGRSLDEVNEDNARSSGMESIAALLERARFGLFYLQSLDDDDILLVSHGSFARALQAAISIGGSYSDYIEPPNAEIIQLI